MFCISSLHQPFSIPFPGNTWEAMYVIYGIFLLFHDPCLIIDVNYKCISNDYMLIIGQIYDVDKIIYIVRSC